MRKAAVIGWPISHSRSPLIHGYWLKKHGIDPGPAPVPAAPVVDSAPGGSGVSGRKR